MATSRPVPGVEREAALGRARPGGFRVGDPRAIPVGVADLAGSGEPEAAGRIEADVVRPAGRPAVARGVDVLDAPGGQVDPLDAPADVVLRLIPGHGEPAEVVPLEAAVVADVDPAVRADGGAVRSTARARDDAHAPIGTDPRERAALDLDQNDAPVRHRERSLGELEAARRRAHPRPQEPLPP